VRVRATTPPSSHARAWLRGGIFLALVVGSGACSGSCKRGTPYVPFLDDAGAADATESGVAEIDAAIDAGRKPGFQPIHASLAPAGTTKWTLEGLAFDAPAGHVILAAIAHDLDGNGQRDVTAYVQPPGGGGGELVFFRGDGKGLAPAVVVGGGSTGADLALPPPCVARIAMTLVGPRTVALDLRPSCGDAAPAPRRYVLAAFAGLTPSVRFAAKISEPPPGWTLGLDTEAIDRDGDGVDDPTITLSLEGGGAPFEPGERVVARLRYWDRPAGFSRDRTEPEVSFQQIARRATELAGKKGTAAGVAPLVRRLRLLHAATCSESGGAWIEVAGDRGVACNHSRGLEDAGAAEVKAALALGDPLSAIAARERVGQGPVTRTAKTRSDVDKAIMAALGSVWASPRDVKAVPSTPAKGAPAWGALAFDKTGNLLVRTSTGVAQFGFPALDEQDTDASSWPWEVTLPGKDARLGAVVDACDAPYLAARVAGHDVPTGTALLPLPMLPSFDGSRCADGRSAAWPLTPVAWGAQGLFAIVAGQPVLVPADVAGVGGGRATGLSPAPASKVDGPWVAGSPRSPSGSFVVAPTRFGVLRRDESTNTTTAALVRAKELEGLYTQLHECAVSNDGKRVACVRDGRIVVLDASGAAAPAPSASETASAPASTVTGQENGVKM
jgi:hypothetical protein